MGHLPARTHTGHLPARRHTGHLPARTHMGHVPAPLEAPRRVFFEIASGHRVFVGFDFAYGYPVDGAKEQWPATGDCAAQLNKKPRSFAELLA
jgi:hypothetical protein